jgi:hypothetical protein
MEQKQRLFMVMFRIIVCLLLLAGPALCQCPDTGETRVIKPNEGTGYYFYHFNGSKSFRYYLDGKKFNLADKTESGRNFFFIDNMGFEVTLVNRSEFKELIKSSGIQGLLAAQAKYEQDNMRKLLPSIFITDLGFQWRMDQKGKRDRLFHLWKKQKSDKDSTGLQYLLTTPLDDNTVVILSMLILNDIAESEVFEQVGKYTSHFDLLSRDQCKVVLGMP